MLLGRIAFHSADPVRCSFINVGLWDSQRVSRLTLGSNSETDSVRAESCLGFTQHALADQRHPPKKRGGGEAKTIESIDHASLARKQLAAVFDSNIPFDTRHVQVPDEAA